MLVYLQAPDVVAKTIALMARAPTQEEQIDYASDPAGARSGLDPRAPPVVLLLVRARRPAYKGGASFDRFLKHIKDDAVATLSESEKAELKPILDARPRRRSNPWRSPPARAFVKAWTLDELAPLVEAGLNEARTSTAAAPSSPPPAASPAIASTTRGAPSAPT